MNQSICKVVGGKIGLTCKLDPGSLIFKIDVPQLACKVYNL